MVVHSPKKSNVREFEGFSLPCMAIVGAQCVVFNAVIILSKHDLKKKNMKGQDLLAGAARAATYNMALQVRMNRL